MKLHLTILSTVCLALASCSSTNIYDQQQKLLASSLQKIEANDLASASRALENQIASTQAQAGELEVQRFYAAFLLTQAHVLASLGQPFLAEPARASGAGIGGQSSAGGSTVGHLVATMNYANLGREFAQKAKGGALTKDGVQLLPESLRDLSIENADTNLDLCILAAYSRLGFEDRVSRTLDASPALHKLETAETVFTTARVPAQLAPVLYHTLFEYLRRRDEPAAFRFAIRTLDTHKQSGGVIRAADTQALEAWILNGSRFVFQCPNCRQPVEPGFRACQHDQTPYLDFFAAPRN